ncbi:hypothetical protein Adt_22801 [Abeliophyllum distichum]|uniref:Uncharacterized protein n=1 Tax=Abeliophyllum distichum TaxID=126358 RepID=A0ABD1S9V7_9LAMI
MNLVRELVLAKELFGTIESFDGQCSEEEAKSKKLSKNLKAMSLEKAQLESDKRALQFMLDSAVAKEADLKDRYEIELKAMKERLKQVRDQKRAAEVFQKRAEDDQKLAEKRTLVVETAVATANNNLEAVAAEKDKMLDAFVDTPEYQDLAQRLMTIGGEQLVKRIMETHPEWDISFLRQASIEVPSFEVVPSDEHDGVKDQTTPLVVEEGPQCANL